MKTFMNAVLVTVVAFGAATFPARAAEPATQLTEDQVHALIQTAKTPEDHLKIADYYRTKAAGLESDAAEHDRMIASVDPMTSNPKFNRVDHCQTWARLDRDAAADATRLAAKHEELAKAAK